MEAAKLSELMASIFGDSDDENEEYEDRQWSHTSEWKCIEQVKGLWICRGFMSRAGEHQVLKYIEAEAWFNDAEANQAMRFGILPSWTLKLSSLIRSSIESYMQEEDSIKERPLPAEILHREPLFNQMIVNKYQPWEGIGPHTDLLRFEDGIAILSLISPRIMTFQHTRKPAQGPVRLLLQPGDLLVISGEARYEWTHEIDAEQQVWDGAPLELESRISVTLRRLRRDE